MLIDLVVHARISKLSGHHGVEHESQAEGHWAALEAGDKTLWTRGCWVRPLSACKFLQILNKNSSILTLFFQKFYSEDAFCNAKQNIPVQN